jgi:2-methylcitrate dehydratase PrpD
MTKPLHAGMACRDGVTATQLAHMGFTAGEQVIEHPFGFANTMLGKGVYDLDEMADNLGKPYRVQDALMIKKYPCGGGNHAMLDSCSA